MLSIIIISFITIVSIFAANIFNGKTKKDETDQQLRKSESIISELKKISRPGWYLISISIILILINGFNSIKTISSNNQQHLQDTIRIDNLLKSSIEINKSLRSQHFSDSIQILELTKLTKTNGIKTDSIKNAVVDNAIKALNEQRKAIERERENTFIHLQNEVRNNLECIIFKYKNETLLGFNDKSTFIINRLSNEFIKKYKLISSNVSIIESLNIIVELTERINQYANEASRSGANSETRLVSIRQMIKNVEDVKNRLASIYFYIKDLKSYKQFETIDLRAFPNKTKRDKVLKDVESEAVNDINIIINNDN